MRLVRLTLFGVLIAAPVLAQGPGGDGERGGRMRMFGGNPDEMFNRFSKGKDYIDRNELDGGQQFFFDRIAQQMGVTNGRITREQFKSATEQFMSKMREGGFGGGGRGGFGRGGFGGPPNPDMVNRFVEERFKQSDKNGDGLLSADEMSDALKSEREKWDTNKDGFIDLTEYKAYTSARFQQRQDERGKSDGGPPGPNGDFPPLPGGTEQPEEPDQRPVVYRAGKLPKELPSWFVELDTDVDGQVGLYEWVKAGRPIDEFRSMDTNDDSFLTPEEALRYTKDGKSLNMNVAHHSADGESSFRGPTSARPYSGGENKGDRSGGNGRRSNGDYRGGGPSGGRWPGSRGGEGKGGDSGRDRRGGRPGPGEKARGQ